MTATSRRSELEQDRGGEKEEKKKKRKEGWTLARNLWTVDEEGMGGDESSVEK